MSRSVLLVVDDEPRIRAFVAEALACDALRVEEATSGQEALELTAELIPDVILLDLHMPRMDGMKALSELRKRPWLARTAIVMFTINRDAATVTACYAYGADDFLAKPFDLGTLEAKVAHWLAERPDHGGAGPHFTVTP